MKALIIFTIFLQGIFSINTDKITWSKIDNSEYVLSLSNIHLDTVAQNTLEKSLSVYKSEFSYYINPKLEFRGSNYKSETIIVKRWHSRGVDVVGGHTFHIIEIYLDNVKIETLYDKDINKIKALINKE